MLKINQSKFAINYPQTKSVKKTADCVNDNLKQEAIGINLLSFRGNYQIKNTIPIIERGFIYNFNDTVDNVLFNHLDKLPITQNLTPEECIQLRKTVNNNGDTTPFFMFALDAKPSVMLVGEHKYLKPDEKYDIFRRTLDVNLRDGTNTKIYNTLLFNKDLMKNTIEENKDFYIKRMKLDDVSTVDDIYSELISENSPLKNNDLHDIIGITLGFSPINSKLFQLEKCIDNGMALRKAPNLYKKKMLNTLFSADSVYANFDDKFKQELAQAIRNIGVGNERYFDTNWNDFGYTYIHITPDEQHNQKIMRLILNTYQKAKNIIE